MVAFQIGDGVGALLLGGDSDGPDPGPKNAVWHIVNPVVIKQIPGKGKKFKTIRTSDKYTPTTGPLWECDLTVRSVTDNRYQQLKEKCEDGGPFLVVCNHGRLNMYIVDCSITHDEKDKEPPMKEADGGFFLNVATWQIKLQEAYD
jgi:arylsulfatase A-like enzyme